MCPNQHHNKQITPKIFDIYRKNQHLRYPSIISKHVEYHQDDLDQVQKETEITTKQNMKY